MGQILIEKTPHEARAVSNMINSERFPGIQMIQGPASSQNLGGRYALPIEFDSDKFASKFVAKGNDVLAAQGQEQLSGTSYVAPGWSVWKYPKFSTNPVTDEEGKVKKDKGHVVYQPHPLADKPHEVHPLDKDGQVLVLMHRPLAIQKTVNQIYGEVSRERMILENQGQTVAGVSNQDSGMLPEERLKKHLGIDPEVEEGALAKSAVLHSTIETDSGVIGTERRVSR